MERLKTAAALALALLFTTGARQADGPPPSVPVIDAPELAALGPNGVGFRSLRLVHHNQPDLLHPDPKTGKVALYDRPLTVDLWYPARVKRDARIAIYRASLYGEPPALPVAFTVRGLAVPNAAAKNGGHPLIIVSHGYGNNPAMVTWLTENLASKGYVVAAIHHEDPNPYVIGAAARSVPNYNRPVDIAFVAQTLKKQLGTLINPDKIALIGYSQGGFGVLAAGGARLDPSGPAMKLVPGGWMTQLAAGAPSEAEGKVPGVKAIVAMAPAGGLPTSAWGPQGLESLTAPLLLIQGDADPVVDYTTGALAVFKGAVNADRYLLTYRQAGHAIALNPAPTEMRSSVWDMDWFEDPVWRPDRMNAINLHFITAFLATNLLGEVDKRSYLDVPVENSDTGTWNAAPGTAWGAYSPGGAGVTLWKGFQRRNAQGMILRHAAATP